MKRAIRTVKFPGIQGNIQVAVDAEDGTVYLDGDKDGLLSLASLMTKLAKIDQSRLAKLPDYGAREHVHLEPDIHLGANSHRLSIGRLDNKHGGFDETFKKRTSPNTRAFRHRW